jgi:hypothetical protein
VSLAGGRDLAYEHQGFESYLWVVESRAGVVCGGESVEDRGYGGGAAVALALRRGSVGMARPESCHGVWWSSWRG